MTGKVGLITVVIFLFCVKKVTIYTLDKKFVYIVQKMHALEKGSNSVCRHWVHDKPNTPATPYNEGDSQYVFSSTSKLPTYFAEYIYRQSAENQ